MSLNDQKEVKSMKATKDGESKNYRRDQIEQVDGINWYHFQIIISQSADLLYIRYSPYRVDPDVYLSYANQGPAAV